MDMINVMGAMNPCHIPFQNPETFPSLSGVFSRSFGPGAQDAKTNIKRITIPKI
jgi:hypothetical protein